MGEHKKITGRRKVWHKILQTACGISPSGHDWRLSESGGSQVRFCRKCGKMELCRFNPHLY